MDTLYLGDVMRLGKSFCYCKVLFIFFVALCAEMPMAQAGWLDFLNPRVSHKDNPLKTLRAPFADEDAVIDELDPSGNTELAVPLDRRHRPNGEITKWVQEIVPAMLTYNASRYEREYVNKITSFSKVGAEEYVAFLQNKSIVKTLKTGRYNVSGIIGDYPVIINEGAVDGRYRWLYQIQVMVTYFENSLKGYSHEKGGDAITQNFILTMQIGRAKGAGNEHGLVIETWGIKNAE